MSNFKSYGRSNTRPRGFYSDPARHHSNPLALLQMLGIGNSKKRRAKKQLLEGPRLDNRMSNQAAVTGSGLGLGFGFRSAGPDPRGGGSRKNQVIPLGDFYRE